MEIQNTCTNCIFFRCFKKREDELSNKGCIHKNWSGYITDENQPVCGGMAHAPRFDFHQRQWRGHSILNEEELSDVDFPYPPEPE
jgi:hypothetical protein